MAAVNLQWWRKWTVVLGGIAGLQLLVQVINAITGWLLVRVLPPSEYALFTLASSIQASLSVMSDLGLSVAFISVGGAVWQDPRQLGSVYNAVLDKRKSLAVIAVVVGFPAGWWLLVHNGASGWYAAALLLTMLTCLRIVPLGLVNAGALRLHQRFRPVQTAELGAALVRFGVSALVALPSACVALVAAAGTAFSQIFFTRRVAHVSASLVEVSVPPSSDHQLAVSGVVRSLTLPALFHGFQGQITTWILGLGGQEIAVASLGALMRFAVLFTLAGVVINQVVAPAVARCRSTAELRSKVFKAVGGYLVYSVLVIFGATLLAPWALWLLGPTYEGLREELLLMMVSLAAGGLTSLVWIIVSSRQWIADNWVSIPLTIGAQVGMAFHLPLGTVSGILVFSALSAVPPLCWYLYLGVRGYRAFRLAET